MGIKVGFSITPPLSVILSVPKVVYGHQSSMHTEILTNYYIISD